MGNLFRRFLLFPFLAQHKKTMETSAEQECKELKKGLYSPFPESNEAPAPPLFYISLDDVVESALLVCTAYCDI